MNVKNLVLPFFVAAIVAVAVHYFLDVRYFEAVIRNGGSAADPVVVWRLFGYRALIVFALSVIPPLLAGTASRQVAIGFAAGIASAYGVMAVIPLTNLWPFSFVIAVVLAGGPALVGGLLAHDLKRRLT